MQQRDKRHGIPTIFDDVDDSISGQEHFSASRYPGRTEETLASNRIPLSVDQSLVGSLHRRPCAVGPSLAPDWLWLRHARITSFRKEDPLSTPVEDTALNSLLQMSAGSQKVRNFSQHRKISI
jgi:hypothetical protein